MACKTTFYLLTLCICASFIFHVCDADAHTQGQDFVFSIPAPYHCSPYILLTARSKSAVVTVTVGLLEFREQYPVDTTNVVRVVLPPSACVRTSGVNDQSIIVHSTNPISVHVFKRNNGGDGFLAIPTGRLGLTYYIAAYQPSDGGDSFIAISSLDIATTIRITPRHERSYNTVTIGPYETYMVLLHNDPTGTRLDADYPISVVAGSQCSSVPHNAAYNCEPLLEQLPPVKELGRAFFVGPFKGRNSGYVCRIIGASDIPTNIQISNRGVVQLNSGDVHEINITREHEVTDSLLEISSNNPVLVMQYMKSFETDSIGDPSMVLITPLDQFSTNISFPVAEIIGLTYYVNVAIDCVHISDLFFDGDTMADWEVLRSVNGTMCLLRKQTTPGLHNLGHRENAPFYATVYGYNKYISGNNLHAYAYAYAYPAGFNLRRLLDKGNSSTGTSTAIIAITVGILVIIAIIVAIVTYCKRKKTPEQRASVLHYYSTHIPTPAPPPEDKHDTCKNKPHTMEDSNNSDEQQYHDIGISSYSTYLSDTEEDSDNPVEEEHDDTGIEIPQDNMENETVGADKDEPYYLEVH
ncbi:uncharacterized protein [Amphiura filiformis]|uniref:uncharacterized protein isoform X1 n=1 Tax=Amphiura filiformis TaxID=82378 RepID=UPI003B21B191